MKNLINAMAVGVCLTAAQAATWDITLEINGLNGGNEASPNSSTATGGSNVGSGIRYDDASNILTLNAVYGLFGFQPLTGDYASSHLHEAPAGVNGPVIVDLASLHFGVGPRAGLYSGNVVLTESQEASLIAGNIYMNIHSTAFPGGEIRGQLTVVPEPEMVALAVLGFSGLVLAMRRRQS